VGDGNIGAAGASFTEDQVVKLSALRDAALALGDVFDPQSAWGAAGVAIVANVTRTLPAEVRALPAQRQAEDLKAVS
jgi:hypothetical protein